MEHDQRPDVDDQGRAPLRGDLMPTGEPGEFVMAFDQPQPDAHYAVEVKAFEPVWPA